MRIYVAGPISTSGEPGPNVHQAAQAAAELRLAGLMPFVPHVNLLLHLVRPDVPISLWMEWDLSWLELCDGLLRLPGHSRGADLEVARALELGLPVFDNVLDAITWGQAKRRVR